MTVDRETLRERAFHLFGQAITRSDPGHLEAWVHLGLTLTQLRVLFLLRAEDGASAGALAERLKVTPSTLTRIVDRLVRQGLVRRESDHGDRRLVRHHLSAKGGRTVEELERGARARMNEVMDRLTNVQLERLVLALTDLTAALDVQATEEIARVGA
ncbi:MAG TPA: MarR family transcriptional regulator [Dehalococcoidia bacterium]|nr:MarR family transcriptional regulator [Dehalococcoidia bacterium]